MSEPDKPTDPDLESALDALRKTGRWSTEKLTAVRSLMTEDPGYEDDLSDAELAELDDLIYADHPVEP